MICIDGGSGDRTCDIARTAGARLIENPVRNEEEAPGARNRGGRWRPRAAARRRQRVGQEDWLARLVTALDSGEDIVSADCLFHAWRPQDPPVTRLCALLGGTDPLAIDLGWADRWAYHRGRWTGCDFDASERDGVLIVGIDPDRPPPMGSNGFLVRRAPLLETSYRPFVHSDVVGDLAAAGWRFARVRAGVVHHYAPTLRIYARKALRRARRTVAGIPAQRRGLRVSRGALAARVLYSISVVGPLAAAFRGYRARPDRAWLLLPALYMITVGAYALATLRALLGRYLRR